MGRHSRGREKVTLQDITSHPSVTSKDIEEWKISRLPVISDISELGRGRNGEKENRRGTGLSGRTVQWKSKRSNRKTLIFIIEIVRKDI